MTANCSAGEVQYSGSHRPVGRTGVFRKQNTERKQWHFLFNGETNRRETLIWTITTKVVEKGGLLNEEYLKKRKDNTLHHKKREI